MYPNPSPNLEEVLRREQNHQVTAIQHMIVLSIILHYTEYAIFLLYTVMKTKYRCFFHKYTVLQLMGCNLGL